MTGQDRAFSAAIEGDIGLLLALDGGKIGTWLYTAADRSFKFSGRAAQLLGLSYPRLDLRDLVQLVHPEDRHEVASAFETIDAGWTCDIDTRIQTGTGPGLLVRIRGASLQDPAEARGIMLDIQRRKGQEESISRLAAIVASSDDAIVSETLDGIVTDWNRGAELIFGYQAEEMLGKSVQILLPEDRKGETNEILEAIRRGERVDHHETRRRRKDGTVIDVSVTVSPVWDAAGNLLQIAVSGQ